MPTIRVLIDEPAAGAWNMAVDEALLEAAAHTGRATLRFYAWEVPTLSLGYFQSAADRQQHASSRQLPLVRRASGGGAIVHDRELTYSLALPQSAGRPAAASELYDALHGSLVAALAELGVAAALYRPDNCTARSPAAAEPLLCFQRRACGDIVTGDAKIVGSAQRRQRTAVLQHGSILLARSAAAPELPGIGELTNRQIAGGDVIAAWLPRVAAALGMRAERQTLDPETRRRAEAIAESKFAAPAFTYRR